MSSYSFLRTKTAQSIQREYAPRSLGVGVSLVLVLLLTMNGIGLLPTFKLYHAAWSFFTYCIIIHCHAATPYLGPVTVFPWRYRYRHATLYLNRSITQTWQNYLVLSFYMRKF